MLLNSTLKFSKNKCSHTQQLAAIPLQYLFVASVVPKILVKQQCISLALGISLQYALWVCDWRTHPTLGISINVSYSWNAASVHWELDISLLRVCGTADWSAEAKIVNVYLQLPKLCAVASLQWNPTSPLGLDLGGSTQGRQIYDLLRFGLEIYPSLGEASSTLPLILIII